MTYDQRHAKVLKICAEQKYRQEEENYLGEMSEYIQLCSLHVSLLSWNDLLKDFMNYLILQSPRNRQGITTQSYSDLPESHPYKMVTEDLRLNGGNRYATFLVGMWDNKVDQFRFSGQEVRVCCRRFCVITSIVVRELQKKKQRRLQNPHYHCISLHG